MLAKTSLGQDKEPLWAVLDAVSSAKGALDRELRKMSAERSSRSQPPLPLPPALPGVEDVGSFSPVERVAEKEVDTARRGAVLGRVRTAVRVAEVATTKGHSSPAEITQWLDESVAELQNVYNDPFSVGADVEVFSRSQGCWVAAKVVEVQGSGRIRVSGLINGHNLRKIVNRNDPTAVRVRFPMAELKASIVDKDRQILALTEALTQLRQEKATLGNTLAACTAEQQHLVATTSQTMQQLATDNAGVTQTLSGSIKELSEQLRDEKARVEHCMKTVQQMQALIAAGHKENDALKRTITKVVSP